MTQENTKKATLAPTRSWLITGASSGLGHALAECVLGHGDQVFMTAPALTGMEALAARYPAAALTLELDVADPLQCIDAVDLSLSHFGAIDVLVTNAAIDFLDDRQRVPGMNTPPDPRMRQAFRWRHD
jgi:NAD(P)-dependent dehydrogenase (short-subunit alcohol dehydrogenase family)